MNTVERPAFPLGPPARDIAWGGYMDSPGWITEVGLTNTTRAPLHVTQLAVGEQVIYAESGEPGAPSPLVLGPGERWIFPIPARWLPGSPRVRIHGRGEASTWGATVRLSGPTGLGVLALEAREVARGALACAYSGAGLRGAVLGGIAGAIFAPGEDLLGWARAGFVLGWAAYSALGGWALRAAAR